MYNLSNKIPFTSKIKKRMANNVDPDETDRYEPSHQSTLCNTLNKSFAMVYVLVCMV